MSFLTIIEKLDAITQKVNQIVDRHAMNGKPPEQTIIDDVDLQNMLHVSKRTTSYWREGGLITFSKVGGKIYYKWSDVLEFIRHHEAPAIKRTLKIML